MGDTVELLLDGIGATDIRFGNLRLMQCFVHSTSQSDAAKLLVHVSASE